MAFTQKKEFYKKSIELLTELIKVQRFKIESSLGLQNRFKARIVKEDERKGFQDWSSYEEKHYEEQTFVKVKSLRLPPLFQDINYSNGMIPVQMLQKNLIRTSVFKSDELVVSAFVDKLAEIYDNQVTAEDVQRNFDTNEMESKPYKEVVNLGFSSFFLLADLVTGTNI